MYRFTRHVYDVSRKYYLLGRDVLIRQVDAKDGQNICEVGCGTARNLIKMAKSYPNVNFVGLDASDEMLKTAQKNINHKKSDVRVIQGFAQNFDPKEKFGISLMDKFVFSYSLSIIPPWKESLDHVISLLPINGEIHIVDFNDMGKFPKFFRDLIFWFLGKFHVYYKPEILQYLYQLEKDGIGIVEIKHIYRHYCYLAKFTKL